MVGNMSRKKIIGSTWLGILREKKLLNLHDWEFGKEKTINSTWQEKIKRKNQEIFPINGLKREYIDLNVNKSLPMLSAMGI